jgi:hypothetical protein
MPGGGVSGSGIEADETPYDQPHARAGAATVQAIGRHLRANAALHRTIHAGMITI